MRSAAAQHGGAADGHLSEFGGHGVPGAVRPGGRRAGAVHVGRQAVGDGRVAVGCGDPDGEHRLVGGVVVAGKHQVGGVGLVGHGEPVSGAHPAAVPVVGGDGVTGVSDGDPHPAAGGQRSVGRDDEVLAGAGEGRGQTVDLHRLDLAVGEVEVDAVEFARRPGVDRGDGRERLAVVAVIGEGEVVRRHVVAGVAEVREEAVTDPERCGRGARGQQADGDGGGEQRGRLASSGVSGTATGASGPGRSAWVGCA